MKIVAPVSSVKEVEMLVHFGADELYCGIRTAEWEEHFGGKWWMNRRDPFNANLGSWEDIQQVVEQAHAQNVPVYLTLNAPFYPRGSGHYLLKLTEKLVSEIRMDGLIVSDMNFLILLAREKFPVRLHLSSLGSCFNSWALDFYLSLGVERIILPRQLRLSEIGRLVTEADSRIEFEAFAMNDGCYFEEGFCQTTHAFGPFCLTNWKVECFSPARRLSQEEIENHLQKLREYLWYQNNCGSSFQATGLPNGPCSLCWFGHFRDWGVTAVKIVGREASFHRKMGSIQLVKAVMDDVRSGSSREEIAKTARSLRATPEYCDKGYKCYFRDL
ncbi:MAG: U32 family peptidase [Candidatus Lindowbacteria bacterium]|nr:U32 family peptidase [Candidatus Lindowbacteria bacterium]